MSRKSHSVDNLNRLKDASHGHAGFAVPIDHQTAMTQEGRGDIEDLSNPHLYPPRLQLSDKYRYGSSPSYRSSRPGPTMMNINRNAPNGSLGSDRRTLHSDFRDSVLNNTWAFGQEKHVRPILSNYSAETFDIDNYDDHLLVDNQDHPPNLRNRLRENYNSHSLEMREISSQQKLKKLLETIKDQRCRISNNDYSIDNDSRKVETTGRVSALRCSTSSSKREVKVQKMDSEDLKSGHYLGSSGLLTDRLDNYKPVSPFKPSENEKKHLVGHTPNHAFSKIIINLDSSISNQSSIIGSSTTEPVTSRPPTLPTSNRTKTVEIPDKDKLTSRRLSPAALAVRQVWSKKNLSSSSDEKVVLGDTSSTNSGNISNQKASTYFLPRTPIQKSKPPSSHSTKPKETVRQKSSTIGTSDWRRGQELIRQLHTAEPQGDVDEPECFSSFYPTSVNSPSNLCATMQQGDQDANQQMLFVSQPSDEANAFAKSSAEETVVEIGSREQKSVIKSNHLEDMSFTHVTSEQSSLESEDSDSSSESEKPAITKPKLSAQPTQPKTKKLTPNKDIGSNNESDSGRPSKPRNYDVQSVRNYLKKQRAERKRKREEQAAEERAKQESKIKHLEQLRQKKWNSAGPQILGKKAALKPVSNNRSGLNSFRKPKQSSTSKSSCDKTVKPESAEASFAFVVDESGRGCVYPTEVEESPTCAIPVPDTIPILCLSSPMIIEPIGVNEDPLMDCQSASTVSERLEALQHCATALREKLVDMFHTSSAHRSPGNSPRCDKSPSQKADNETNHNNRPPELREKKISPNPNSPNTEILTLKSMSVSTSSLRNLVNSHPNVQPSKLNPKISDTSSDVQSIPSQSSPSVVKNQILTGSNSYHNKKEKSKNRKVKTSTSLSIYRANRGSHISPPIPINSESETGNDSSTATISVSQNRTGGVDPAPLTRALDLLMQYQSNRAVEDETSQTRSTSTDSTSILDDISLSNEEPPFNFLRSEDHMASRKPNKFFPNEKAKHPFPVVSSRLSPVLHQSSRDPGHPGKRLTLSAGNNQVKTLEELRLEVERDNARKERQSLLPSPELVRRNIFQDDAQMFKPLPIDYEAQGILFSNASATDYEADPTINDDITLPSASCSEEDTETESKPKLPPAEHHQCKGLTEQEREAWLATNDWVLTGQRLVRDSCVRRHKDAHSKAPPSTDKHRRLSSSCGYSKASSRGTERKTKGNFKSDISKSTPGLLNDKSNYRQRSDSQGGLFASEDMFHRFTENVARTFSSERELQEKHEAALSRLREVTNQKRADEERKQQTERRNIRQLKISRSPGMEVYPVKIKPRKDSSGCFVATDVPSNLWKKARAHSSSNSSRIESIATDTCDNLQPVESCLHESKEFYSGDLRVSKSLSDRRLDSMPHRYRHDSSDSSHSDMRDPQPLSSETGNHKDGESHKAIHLAEAGDADDDETTTTSVLESSRTQEMRRKLKKMRLDKKSLTEREQRLHKRRKQAEELLRWKRALDEEEDRILNMEHTLLKECLSNQNKTTNRSSLVMTGSTTLTNASNDAQLHLTEEFATPLQNDNRIMTFSVGPTNPQSGDTKPEIPPNQECKKAPSEATKSDDSNQLVIVKHLSKEIHQTQENDKNPPASIREAPPTPSETKISALTPDDLTLVKGDTSDAKQKLLDIIVRQRKQALPPDAPRVPNSDSPGGGMKKALRKSRRERNKQSINTRRRHMSTSGEEEEEVQPNPVIPETPSEASDIELQINALKDELKKRKETVAMLKAKQKSTRMESKKHAETTLQKQIELYDNYIEQLEKDLQTEPPVTQPVSSIFTAVSNEFSTPQLHIRPKIKSPRAVFHKSVQQQPTIIDEEKMENNESVKELDKSVRSVQVNLEDSHLMNDQNLNSTSQKPPNLPAITDHCEACVNLSTDFSNLNGYFSSDHSAEAMADPPLDLLHFCSNQPDYQNVRPCKFTTDQRSLSLRTIHSEVSDIPEDLLVEDDCPVPCEQEEEFSELIEDDFVQHGSSVECKLSRGNIFNNLSRVMRLYQVSDSSVDRIADNLFNSLLEEILPRQKISKTRPHQQHPHKNCERNGNVSPISMIVTSNLLREKVDDYHDRISIGLTNRLINDAIDASLTIRQRKRRFFWNESVIDAPSLCSRSGIVTSVDIDLTTMEQSLESKSALPHSKKVQTEAIVYEETVSYQSENLGKYSETVEPKEEKKDSDHFIIQHSIDVQTEEELEVETSIKTFDPSNENKISYSMENEYELENSLINKVDNHIEEGPQCFETNEEHKDVTVDEEEDKENLDLIKSEIAADLLEENSKDYLLEWETILDADREKLVLNKNNNTMVDSDSEIMPVASSPPSTGDLVECNYISLHPLIVSAVEHLWCVREQSRWEFLRINSTEKDSDVNMAQAMWRALEEARETPPDSFTMDQLLKEDSGVCSESSLCDISSVPRLFLYHLVHELVSEVYRDENRGDMPPWVNPIFQEERPQYKVWGGLKRPSELSQLISLIVPRAFKSIFKHRLMRSACSLSLLEENLDRMSEDLETAVGDILEESTVDESRFSRVSNWTLNWKPRNYVDRLLAEELLEDETKWTDYYQEEVVVKEQLTQYIWNRLVHNTQIAYRQAKDKKQIKANLLKSRFDSSNNLKLLTNKTDRFVDNNNICINSNSLQRSHEIM